MSDVTLYCGDCLEILPTLAPQSVDAIVCDPPYGLSFMGKDWDHGVPGVPFWEAALRVAKPGAMLLAFGGTRTHHRLMCAIEDAGWEIRDCLMWLYGSGFPKSMDMGKAIDKAAGAEREVVGPNEWAERGGLKRLNTYGEPSRPDSTAPSTDEAKQWDGWGTALKPAWEPIIMAMKPIDGTFANNALVHGVAGINIDASRIAITDGATMARNNKPGANGWKNSSGGPNSAALHGEPQGRWPANLILDEEAAAMLDAQSGTLTSGGGNKSRKGNTAANNCYGTYNAPPPDVREISTGGASRFFYVAKASKRDRDEGLDEMNPRAVPMYGAGIGEGINPNAPSYDKNFHPTVKPTQLMRYLVRLVTPQNGVVLDPFMGSGSTGKAAILEGFNFVGIEKEADFVTIAQRRIADAQAQPALLVTA